MAANPQLPVSAGTDRSEALVRHENALRLDELFAREPECTCQQTDVDLFDPRGCELHNESSSWNVEYRAVTDVQRYEEMKQEVSDVCPF